MSGGVVVAAADARNAPAPPAQPFTVAGTDGSSTTADGGSYGGGYGDGDGDGDGPSSPPPDFLFVGSNTEFASRESDPEPSAGFEEGEERAGFQYRPTFMFSSRHNDLDVVGSVELELAESSERELAQAGPDGEFLALAIQ